MEMGGKVMVKSVLGATALASILLSGGALAQDKIKVGVTATLEGTYTILGVDGIAGFNAAVKKYSSKAGG
jgi:outer membrane murein-binding lipoprotein Lpp